MDKTKTKTVVEQLADSMNAVADLSARIEAVQKESADKIAALDKSVADITAERDALKAENEKAKTDLTAAAAHAAELSGKVAALEARLANPTFTAAAATGTAEQIPVDGEAKREPTLAELEAAYMTEKDETKLADIRQKIMQLSKKGK